MVYKDSKFIVFQHIEKNGGITLHNILHNSFLGYISPRPNYGKYFTLCDLNKLQKVYPFKITGIGGHRINASESYHSDQFLFTFLRNPVDRYLSHLNYQINKMGINWNIEKFLENPNFNNFQTYRVSNTRDLDKAINIINKRFSFIGLMEEYDSSLIYLGKFLETPIFRKNYIKRNVSKTQDRIYIFNNLEDKIKDRIIENNKIDIALYDYVKKNIYSKYKVKYENLNFKDETIESSIIESKLSYLKRKLSTFYIGRFVQPYILKQEKE